MTKLVSVLLILASLLSAKTSAQDDGTGDYELLGIAGGLMLRGIAYVTIGKYDREAHLHNSLAQFPYLNENAGNYVAPDDMVARRFRVEAENHLMFSGGGVYGNHLNLMLRPLPYFFFRANVIRVEEFLRSANQPSFSILDLNICYDRLRFPKINLGWMFGLYCLNSVREQHTGITAGFNLEWFILKPVSIHHTVSWGGDVHNFDIIARYHHRRLIFSVGYQTLQGVGNRHQFATAGFGGYF
jgi:hypothetical protein